LSGSSQLVRKQKLWVTLIVLEDDKFINFLHVVNARVVEDQRVLWVLGWRFFVVFITPRVVSDKDPIVEEK